MAVSTMFQRHQLGIFKDRTCKHTPFLPIKTLYINVRITGFIRMTWRAPLETIILWPPAAPFSSASTWPRAVSRTSTHEFDLERVSLLFGESATTISYHKPKMEPKDESDVIWWMGGWIFTGHQITPLVCSDEINAHPKHLFKLFYH